MSVAPQVEPVRVLLVDDTADLRDLLRFALEQHEFRVVGEAADGRSGIERAEATQPDLVLLDLAMPVMDGFTALPQIRHVCPGAVVLVLSGFDAATTGARALELGAHGYLQKGSSLRSTVAQVREAMGRTTQPTLTVVGDTDHRPTATEAAPALGMVETDPQAPTAARPAWLEAVPFGVVEVDARTLRVRHANRAAQRLLGAVPCGVSLPARLPELDTLTEGTHHVDRDGVRLGVTLTRSDDALVLVVSPQPRGDLA